jgi:hydroxyacylglutathione hydrolase
MGASNQYRRLWQSKVWLHDMDAKHSLAAEFEIDHYFNHDFTLYTVIDAFPIGGHTPGFTLYIHQDVLFISDYVF